ncbi:MAG: PEP-CTERM sorting domain-containing protein [Akkermansia sp.]|nr:PEP-CTERM sorting domain-containing protein [Akkermansia sp.]
MKKTLTLLALAAVLGAPQLTATEHWADGVTFDKTTKMATGAYTSYKHNSVSGSDAAMCWAAAASNLIAWWQDRTEENGAIIIPDGTPRGYEVWETVRTLWYNQGGWAPATIQHWIHGETISCGYDLRSSDGYNFNGYYNRISGAEFRIGNYHAYSDFEPEGALISTYSVSSHDFAGASKWLADGFDNGDVFAFATDLHVMTVYGVNYNEKTGTVDDFYWTDNNNSNDNYPKDRLIAGTAWDNGTDGEQMYVFGAGSNKVRYLYGIHTTGIHFTDYDVVRNAERKDEMFSHYCNVVMDDGESFELQYDLRDANAADSPVLPYIYTYDGTEVVDKEHVTTGDVFLNNGSLSLVEGVEKFDGGGAVSGTIFFADSEQEGAARTLSVDRTAKVAAAINIAAAEGNTLNVTQGNTASFGTLSGEGNLDKTGLGAAEVTEGVTLKGDIRVHEGRFIFGTDATISETTTLTVDAGAYVQGKEGKSLTLTIASGVHENNGVMTLATTVKDGAVLKGSGTFAGVTVDNGGTLIVGNSPGRQTYTGDLSVNLGEIVFGVSGWDTAADEDHVGWGSGTYSNVVMNGNSLTLGGDSMIRFGVGNDALAALLGSDSGTAFSMTIATGIGNGDYFKSGVLDQLAAQTIFYVTDELGAVITNDAELNAGDSLNTRITDLKYKLEDNTNLCVTGVYWAAEPMVPEPTTGTMTLLALAGLCARRRRK